MKLVIRHEADNQLHRQMSDQQTLYIWYDTKGTG